MDVVLQSLSPTLVGKLQDERQRGVVQRKSRRARNRSRHVSNAISTTKVGLECVVGFEVSAHPPWSMAMSTNTDPCFIVFSIVRVMSLGAEAPGTSTAPITRSALAARSAIAARVEKIVRTRPSN